MSISLEMKIFLSLLMFVAIAADSGAQVMLTLDDAIAIGQRKSYSAKMADFRFMNDYWSYRNYRAAWLPSLNLSGTLMNYNRSIVEARDYETGRVSYVDNNSLYNAVALSVNQNLPWADGTVSLRSNLSRLDQFDYNHETYNSTPLLLYYNQPLRRYSNLRWRRRIEPLQYESAKRSYLETMQSITISVTGLFFQALSAQSDLERTKARHRDLTTLYEKTERRLDLGLVTKGELLQLELSLLNVEMGISYSRLSLENALFNLFSYLHIDDYKNIVLVAPSYLPDLSIGVDDVIEKSHLNSTHTIERQLQLLNAEKNLAYTKAETGLQVSLQAQLGLTQTADNPKGAYSRLKDNEVVGITFSLPIYDWGQRRGSIRMAKAQLELARTQMHQSNMEHIQEIRTTVMHFNNQAGQCKISRRALDIAEETYLMAYKRYANGALSVTDLNNASNDLENAHAQYLAQLNTFWSYYYTIQRLTLYNYIKDEAIDCDFEAIIRN